MSKKVIKLMENVRNAPKKFIIPALVILGVGAVLVILTVRDRSVDEDITYREAAVEYGSLVVGVEESGAVDIGTVEQVFELDMSALQRVETSGSSENGNGSMSSGSGSAGSMMPGGVSAGGMGNASVNTGAGAMSSFAQIFNMAGSSTSVSGESSILEIAEVCVSVGQQVEEGDVLYTLVEDGVKELASELESNVKKAKADLDALIADQELSKVTAENTYDASIAYGDYAELEKSSTIASLEQAVEEKKNALETAEKNIVSVQEKLEQAEYDLNLAKQVLDNAEWAVEHADMEDVLTYNYHFENAKQSQSSYESLEKEKEQLEKSLEQAEANLETCKNQLANAERSLASGKLSAEQMYELRMLAYNNAQETYDITVAYLEDDLAAQEEIYAEAQEKWNEFSSHIDGNQVRAKYSGVITSVDLAVGDSLTTGATIATLYDVNEVSMTVTLEEEDMTHIEVGGMANISFTAYPEDIFKAVVSEISDASSDSSGNTTYDVTVTLQGDASRLFQGMTGDITFITKETEEVMYVSNRAIIREGIKSYVKVKDEKGNIKKTQVVTGFSDGVNVEIVEGLEIGDVVLIESKVTNE